MDLWERDYQKAVEVGNEIKKILGQKKKESKKAKNRAILRGKITQLNQIVQFLSNQLNNEYIKRDNHYVKNEATYINRLNALENMKNEISSLYENYASTNDEDAYNIHMERLNEYYDEEKETGISDLSKEEFLLKQQNLMKLQDEQLDFLEGTTHNLKNISYTINTELNVHNELLDDISRDFDETNDLLNRNTNVFARITRSASNFVLYLIIGILTTTLILFIIIL